APLDRPRVPTRRSSDLVPARPRRRRPVHVRRPPAPRASSLRRAGRAAQRELPSGGQGAAAATPIGGRTLPSSTEPVAKRHARLRSEEHTSELQSRENLV